MRMIDANALKTSFEEDGHLSNYIEEFIDNAPTIDAEPVRHGLWIQSKIVPDYHYCSLCKVAHKMQMSCNVYVLLKYCPHCGAKMDGDDENAHEV